MDSCKTINFVKHVKLVLSKLTLFALHDDICESFHKETIHASAKLGRRQFWHALQKRLLSSHPWPNMNDQCAIWKNNRYAIIHWYQFHDFSFQFWRRDLGLNLGFLFLKSHCIVTFEGRVVLLRIRGGLVSMATWAYVDSARRTGQIFGRGGGGSGR